MIELADTVPPHHDLHPVKVLLKITTGAAPKLQVEYSIPSVRKRLTDNDVLVG